MRTLTPAAVIPDDARGCAIALGNFDGVHQGHQAVVASAARAAQALGAKLGAAMFEPHPRRFFQPAAPAFRLQSPRQRAHALATLGVKELFEIGFDAALADTSPEDFVSRVLHALLGVTHVSVGHNFRFGRARAGDAHALKSLAASHNIQVEVVAPVRSGDEAISSSVIRAAIAAGDMTRANRLLTRPFAIEGEVQRGFARGRELGFPTANVSLGAYVRPRLGVYAVRVILSGGASAPGVASIGVNPTTGALSEPLLEAHLFDFVGDLYGQNIEVELVAFLRPEAHFDGVQQLQTQMRQDAMDARAALAQCE